MKCRVILSFLLVFILIPGATCSGKNISGGNDAKTGPDTGGQVAVSFIDVGQGDAIFIQLPGNKTMLVDAGTKEAGQAVPFYLRKHEIRQIDYLVATHPHEDHIGGMKLVVKDSFDNGRIYMPRVTAN